ncbi:MAG: ArsR family transcriptional regulator [Armatimonadota bacterium]|nr:ArsR family transcriptional regulator [Armatimonadota bacterium]MDR5697004.1 ArsR family transcriptional regulator [Armatimonadota bacterium]
MARAILLSPHPSALHVRVEACAVYDFLAALFVVHRHGRGLAFDVADAWVERARRGLGQRSLRDLDLLSCERGTLLSLVALLDRRAVDDTVAGFVGHVREVPADELVLTLLASARAARPVRQHLREALRTRGVAREAALARFAAGLPQELRPEAAVELARMDPQAVRDRLVRLLTRFHERVYAGEEPRVLPLLRADAERKRRRAQHLSPQAFVEEATGGHVLDPTQVTEVVVVPSYFVRPFNLIADHVGVRTYVVPLGEDESVGEPTEVVVRVAKALGDETRLRILRMLMDREMYTQQVAEALGTSHVTAIHHLAALRAAHLIRIVERQNLKFYVLRPEGLQEALGVLSRFLRPGASPAS